MGPIGGIGKNFAVVGVGDPTLGTGNTITNANTWGYWDKTGQKYNTSAATYGAIFTAGDTIGVAWDADTGSLEFFKNNASQGVAWTSGVTGTYAPWIASGNTHSMIGQFSSADLTYTPPTGYTAWGGN